MDKEKMLNEINNVPIFKDIEDQRMNTEKDALETLNYYIKETDDRKAVLKSVINVCQIYQLQGYIKGVNRQIQLLNAQGGKQIQVHDIDTGERIV